MNKPIKKVPKVKKAKENDAHVPQPKNPKHPEFKDVNLGIGIEHFQTPQEEAAFSERIRKLYPHKGG